MPRCSVHRAVDLIGSKWTLLILHQLCEAEHGFNELLHGIEGINPRALSLRLKDLAEHQLITKTVRATTPVRVTYALTPHGRKLKGIIEQLGVWANGLPPRVTASGA